MKAKDIPLTTEQADFAADHHNLIFAFLRKNHYTEDDFYDIAVFGYLRAVRNYFNREDLRTYAFSTIAWNCMRTDIGNHFRAGRTQMRYGETISLDENTDKIISLRDYVSDDDKLMAA